MSEARLEQAQAKLFLMHCIYLFNLFIVYVSAHQVWKQMTVQTILVSLLKRKALMSQ